MKHFLQFTVFCLSPKSDDSPRKILLIFKLFCCCCCYRLNSLDSQSMRIPNVQKFTAASFSYFYLVFVYFFKKKQFPQSVQTRKQPELCLSKYSTYFKLSRYFKKAFQPILYLPATKTVNSCRGKDSMELLDDKDGVSPSGWVSYYWLNEKHPTILSIFFSFFDHVW